MRSVQCMVLASAIAFALFGALAAKPVRAGSGPDTTDAAAKTNVSSSGEERLKRSGSGAASDDHPFTAFSFSADKGPIDIKSDALSLDYKAKIIVFRGHVHGVQSGTDLTSDVLQVRYGKDFNDIQIVVADGHVKITQGGRWAIGDHAVLDQAARTIEMTGSPVIHDGPDEIAGSKILIYLDSQKSVVEGAHAVIFPRKQETRDNKPVNDASDHSAGRKD